MIEDLNHQLKTATTKSQEFESKYSEMSKELALKVKEIQGYSYSYLLFFCNNLVKLNCMEIMVAFCKLALFFVVV